MGQRRGHGTVARPRSRMGQGQGQRGAARCISHRAPTLPLTPPGLERHLAPPLPLSRFPKPHSTCAVTRAMPLTLIPLTQPRPRNQPSRPIPADSSSLGLRSQSTAGSCTAVKRGTARLPTGVPKRPHRSRRHLQPPKRPTNPPASSPPRMIRPRGSRNFHTGLDTCRLTLRRERRRADGSVR
ncbi:hypothetical protein M427DRAFT_409523 [Gonapodya prolifera JEL478]|uniref:Uncharacterized protein n=1 Tax=Gonapodya prolifera (strain JEL478) TaxID=1344416 RepID=A0A139A6E9_GONPJ|nr:hypothetical protein M427DRAFT_409523 [Gonapodya prolifera JEL478]|eukprot:KXS12238.1 hypothetical protein M427DRAFT_409523 [Gonapodya prolifera JEL478]